MTKKEKYQSLIPKLKALLDESAGIIANLANASALLKQEMGYYWVGFYLVGGDKLTLGPFQGSAACTSIPYGKGVCGTSWEQERTLVVDDVDDFPGHIACSPESRSEIVVPVFDREGKVAMVLDIDSDKPASFDSTDRLFLEQVTDLLEAIL